MLNLSDIHGFCVYLLVDGCFGFLDVYLQIDVFSSGFFIRKVFD